MALLRSIIAREIAVKKRTDDSEIRIRIPLHIIAIAKKMTETDKTNKAKAKKEKTPVAKAGRKSGTGNYTTAETMHLLHILERVEPIGSEEWQQCANEHAGMYPRRCKGEVGMYSIRRKFASLYRKGIPTGDPNCPEDVRLAKKIKRAIGDRAAIGDGEELFNLEDTSFTAKPDPDAPQVADPPLGDEGDSEEDPVLVTTYDEGMVPRQPRRPVKRAYRGRPDPKLNFVQLMQMNMLQQQKDREMNMLQQQKERAEDRKERADDRQQMMAMMMAMMTGRQPTPVPPPPVPRPPPIELDGSSDSDGSNSDSDSDLEAAFKLQKQALDELLPKRVAPPVGVTTRFHKKKRGLGNSSSGNVEVSDFI